MFYQNAKKIIFKVILLQSILYSNAFANNAQEYQRMQAQVGITEDSISHWTQEVLQGFGEGRTSSFNTPDYNEKARAFNSKVERAMEHFERIVRDEVLTELLTFSRRYNSVYHDPNLSDEQKTVLLNSYKDVIEGQMIALRQRYRSALLRSYHMVADLPLQLKIRKDCANFQCDTELVFRREDLNNRIAKRLIFDGNHSLNFSRGETLYNISTGHRMSLIDREANNNRYIVNLTLRFGYDIYGRGWTFSFEDIDRDNFCANSLGVERECTRHERNNYQSFNSAMGYAWLFQHIFEISKENFYRRFVYPEVSKDCRSLSCLTLSNLDLVTFFNLAKTSLDKNIEILLDDGNKITLRRPSIALGGILSLLEMPVHRYSNLPYQVESN